MGTADAAFFFEDQVSALGQLAQRLCGNRTDAEDLVQDTFERALRAEARYTERGMRSGWLATILRNRFRDRCRELDRSKATAFDVTRLPAPQPDDVQHWQRVTETDLAAALAQLDPIFRRVVELHAAGRSYAGIATELGIPLNTVGTRLMRARKKLYQLLRET